MRALDAAALADAGLDVGAAWAVIERIASRDEVDGAVAVVEELVPDDRAALNPSSPSTPSTTLYVVSLGVV